jgi:hypothetical protein
MQMVLVLWFDSVLVLAQCGVVLCVCIGLVNLVDNFVIFFPISRAYPSVWCRHTPLAPCK